MRRVLASLVVVVGACGGASKPPPPPVANTPPVPSCDDAAGGYARARIEHVSHGEVAADELRPKLAARVARACVDGAWSDEARACFADERAPIAGQPEPPACEARLSAAQASALDGAVGALRAELEASRPKDPELAAFERRAAAVSTGIPACDAYIRSLVVLAKCEKIPPESRRAAVQGGDAMLEAWKSMGTMDPQARAQVQQTAGDACQQAADALLQTVAAMGCTVP